jgi:hypothetical protein
MQPDEVGHKYDGDLDDDEVGKTIRDGGPGFHREKHIQTARARSSYHCGERDGTSTSGRSAQSLEYTSIRRNSSRLSAGIST